METLKVSFNVHSDDQGSHPDDLSVSAGSPNLTITVPVDVRVLSVHSTYYSETCL